MGLFSVLIYSFLLCTFVIAQEINESPETELIDNNNDIDQLPRALLSGKAYTENRKPRFKDCETYVPEVKEGQIRLTHVIQVHADDPDKGNDGNITYNIEDGENTRPPFIINATTGDIYTNIKFDRDEPTFQKELYIIVKAIDNGHPPLADICTFKVIILDINDNAPIFDLPEYKAEVSEDQPENSEVLRVVAYDFDDGENSRLNYKFSYSPQSAFEEYFRIDNTTGVVYLKKKLYLKRGIKLAATVMVNDNGIPPLTASAEISFTVADSNKKPPRILDYTEQITIKEDFSEYATPLVTIHGDSMIDNKDIVFELLKGKTIQTNKKGTFALSQTNQSAIIVLGSQLDYETVTEYQLTVRTQNSDGLFASVTIVVKIEDVNDEIPQFIELIQGSVVENDVVGAQAMTVRAFDKDGTSPNNKVVYKLRSHQDLFEIDVDSGVITAKKSFDRETNNLYPVSIEASDSAPSALLKNGGPNSAVQTFFISIEDQNDNPPHFTKSLYIVYNISENANKGKDVIEVKAVDKDTASEIRYSIIEGNIDDAFEIEVSTGRIKVKGKLDFEKIESYNLTVKAYDGIYEDTAKVTINIENKNDEIPVFEKYNKKIYIKEESVSTGCIITLRAYDPDIKNRSADQKIIYDVVGDYKSFLSVTSEGCVSNTMPLDRDAPNGAPSYQAFIVAIDNNGGPNSMKAAAEIIIILEDINDNAPILNITEVVWYENQPPGKIVTLTAIDYDSLENGPPFTYELGQADNEIYEKFKIEDDMLFAKVEFDREEKKFYDVPIKITDSGKPPQSAVSILRVIIGDRNDNLAKDGFSEIFVYKYEGFNTDFQIGRIYVDDPDDWDLPDKVFQADDILNPFFQIQDGGMLLMKKETAPNIYNLKFKVTETTPNDDRNVVKADVTVTVRSIPEEAVIKSGSIRLKGATIEQFVEKHPETHISKKDKLQRFLSQTLNTSLENVDVFTVMTTPSNSSFVDVRFSAHGSPYYSPEKLNNKATELQESLEQDLGVEFLMVSINECLLGTSCNTSCTNKLVIEQEPAVVFTNKTSFVGVKAVAKAICECAVRKVTECYNGGSPIENGICSCPEGVEGPHCEILGVSFAGDGWAMYPTFDSCERNVISLNVLPHTDNGLIFYVGPVTARHATLSHEFISVELRDAYVVLKMDLGSGPIEVISKYKKINDGAMHSIKVNYTTADVQIEVDECPSDCLTWRAFETGKGGILNVNGPLQVGGRSLIFTEEEGKLIWGNPPTREGFKGCVTNFTYNSYLYNLGAPSDDYHAHVTCNYGMFQAATFGIDSNFLVAILVCLAILLILLLAVVVHKRKQDNLNEKDMDDTRENIINYEDEGGGECDTNFDLSVLRPMDEKQPIRDNLYKQGPDVPADIGSFLDDKKRSCDKDNLPLDDVRHYGYEGDGNSSGSLSSLASCTDEGDLKFNYLSSFGPRFRKLADMYGDDASEEGSQNGREEESWC